MGVVQRSTELGAVDTFDPREADEAFIFTQKDFGQRVRVTGPEYVLKNSGQRHD
jgi:hypothetical protein